MVNITTQQDISLLTAYNNFDIVVVPSMTYKFYETLNMTIILEERGLALLKLLDNEGSRIIFLISSPLEADILKERLKMYAHGKRDLDLEKRVIVISTNDDSNRSLTDKILAREDVIAEIRSNIRDINKSTMVPFICTDLDEELKRRIGIPEWLGSSPALSAKWGYKSGSRQIFTESNVPVALGVLEPIFDVDALHATILDIVARSASKSVIIKLDDGSGGYGNVVVDFPRHGSVALDRIIANVRAAVTQMMEYTNFIDKVIECGAIVEEMVKPVPGLKQTSPSVQLFISNDGEVQVISSHEQVINVCTYEGCRFPADEHYNNKIVRYAHDAGVTLASKDVRGFFGVDFLATQLNASEWDVIALEINLRLCATTYTYFSLLTVVEPKQANKKHYLAIDEVKLAKNHTVARLTETLGSSGLAFDYKRGHGIIFTALTRLSSHNEVNMMYIGDSVSEVDALRAKFTKSFMSETIGFPLAQAPLL